MDPSQHPPGRPASSGADVSTDELEVPVDHLGRTWAREACRTEDVRHRGQVFTPPGVVRLMLDLAGLEPGMDASLLDPACGSGAILLGAAVRLGTAGRLTGIELDARPAALAASNLEPLGERASIRVGDALAMASELEGRFDCVVSNPPYVAWHRIDPAVRRPLEAEGYLGCPLAGRPRHRDQQPDLSLYFLLLGLHTLRPGGRLVFLLPPEWLTAPRVGVLREHLTAGATLEHLVHFDGETLFGSEGPGGRRVQTGSMLLVVRRERPAAGRMVGVARVHRFDPDEPLEVGHLSGWLREASGSAPAGVELERLPQASFGAGPWPRAREERAGQAGTVPLSSVPGVRVMCGHQPKVAWLDWLELSAAERNALPEGERRWLLPAAREAREITAPRMPPPRRYWVFLPRDLEDEAAVRALAPVLHARMRSRLEASLAGLEGGTAPARWWAFPNARNLELCRAPGPRLLAPRTAPHPRVCWDEHGHQVKGTNTVIRIDEGAPVSLAVLFGLLNSGPMRRWAEAFARRYHGQGVLQEPKELGRMPVPLEALTASPGLVARLEAAVGELLSSRDTRGEIDRIVEALFAGVGDGS